MATSAHELRKSWRTLSEMLRDRGFAAAELESISPDDFAAAMIGKYSFHIDLPSIKHRVIYELNSRFKSVSVKKLVEDPEQDIVIIIAKEKPSSTALKGLEAAGKEVQLFHLSELQFNVSHHCLVPKHTAVRDDATIEAVMNEFQVKSRFHFPLILSSDPMARYLGLKHGQIVHIERISPSAGTYDMYRCCMKA
jgi:DNA-directed RNA polymerase I, II, and III subunit RPABC1